MTKRGIITLSIFVLLLIVTGVLFGTVFCLRKQTVTVNGETPISVSKEELIETANLKIGSSIFMLDKEEAINNIEKTYANIKVIQIKTESLFKVNFIVRARHEMLYADYQKSFYIFDEDLKVMRIIAKTYDESDEVTNTPSSLIKIESELLNLTESTKVCDFVGSDFQKTIVSGLYSSMITVVTKQNEEDEEYFDRIDMINAIEDISFEHFNTFNKLIIKTTSGVLLDIENPSHNLQHKINICFSTMKKFEESEEQEIKDKVKSGTIRVYLDENNQIKTAYIP